MRYCHECEAEVGPKATECGECEANLIGSTANSQGSVQASSGGFLSSIRELFDSGGSDEDRDPKTPTSEAATRNTETTLSDGTTITDPAAFSHRSLGVQVLLTIVTLGLYTTYWGYITNEQLQRGTNKSVRPVLRLVGLLVPPITLAVFWFMSDDLQGIAGQSNVVLFACALFVPPAFWYFVQSGINDIAAEA